MVQLGDKIECLAKLHGFFEDPKITCPLLMLSWRKILSYTSCGPWHDIGGWLTAERPMQGCCRWLEWVVSRHWGTCLDT